MISAEYAKSTPIILFTNQLDPIKTTITTIEEGINDSKECLCNTALFMEVTACFA